MDSTATSRNKARDFENYILGRIAAQGVTAVAKKIGLNKSQVSRWQSPGGFVEKVGLLLDAINFDQPEGLVMFQGEETADLARGLIAMLEHIRNSDGGNCG